MKESIPGFVFEPYTSLLFVPVGRKHPEIRSIGHKEERAILSRVQQIVSAEIATLSPEEHLLLEQFLAASDVRLPIGISKKERLYPHFIKPVMFLWKKHSLKRGLPLQDDLFYDVRYGTLSADELVFHVKQLVKEYVFYARIDQAPPHTWLEKIKEAYADHPFISLARSKKNVIEAVEVMNKSSLLAVLKYPEDLAFWRHRVEIVMRPYRQIPADWKWSVCTHEKELTLHYEEDALLCSCPACSFSVKWNLFNGRVELPNEVSIEQAVKRIATIERQFNEIALQSMNVIEGLRTLQQLKQQLAPYEEIIRSCAGEAHPAVLFSLSLRDATFLEEQIEPDLLSLSHVKLPDVTLLKKAEHIRFDTLQKELLQLHEELKEQALLRQPKPTDVLFHIGEFHLTRSDVLAVTDFLQETDINMTLHLLAQLLKGTATAKIRQLELHHASIFGLLAAWPDKYIVKAVKAAIPLG